MAEDVAAPIMPSGLGIADLDIAQEQDAVAQDVSEDSAAAGEVQADDARPAARADAPALEESQAHPS